MHIGNDKNLTKLADLSNKSASRLSEEIISSLINSEIISDSIEYYGDCIKDAISRDVTDSELIAILNSCNCPVNSETIECFLNLKIMGEGICPYCGGDGEMIDYETYIVGGDNYNIPYDKECSIIYKCNNCKTLFSVL